MIGALSGCLCAIVCMQAWYGEMPPDFWFSVYMLLNHHIHYVPKTEMPIGCAMDQRASVLPPIGDVGQYIALTMQLFLPTHHFIYVSGDCRNVSHGKTLRQCVVEKMKAQTTRCYRNDVSLSLLVGNDAT